MPDPNLDPNLLQYAGLANGPQAQPLNPDLNLQSTAMPTPGGQGNGSFDPATVQAMLALHGQRNQMASIDRSRKLADQLRSDSSSLMRPKQAGRLVVGPKWYDAAASLAGDYVAGRQDKKLDEKAAGLDTAFGTTMQDIIDKYNAKSQR